MVVGELQVAQVHALQGRQERYRRGGGASDLDDAGRSRLRDRGLFVLGGPDLAERRVALGQVVGRRVTDAYLGLEEDGELVGQLGGGGARDDLSGARGNGGDAVVCDRDVEAEQLGRGGEPLELGEDRTLFQLPGNHAGVQIVADNHAFTAGPILGHVTTFLFVVTSSHHSMIPLCRAGRFFARPSGQR